MLAVEGSMKHKAPGPGGGMRNASSSVAKRSPLCQNADADDGRASEGC